MKTSLAVGFGLFVATAAVYCRVGTYDFVPFDDREYVADHLRVQAGLTPANIAWAWTTDHFSNWHPLTWLSYMLDCELWGPRPGPMHLVNVAWHIVNSVLLFCVLRRLTMSVASSAVVAFLFALHPLHVESVAWISERKDVLSGFFFILTIAAYASYVRRPSWARYLLTALWLFLGLTAKAMLVTTPCVLLLLDYWPLNRGSVGEGSRRAALLRFGRLFVEKLPLFGVVAVSCFLTFLAQLQGRSVGGLEALPISSRLANAAIAYLTYVGKTIWPIGLAPYYPHPADTAPGGPTDVDFLIRGALAAVVLAVLTTAIVVIGRRKPYLTVGWFWFLGTLVPVIGVVQVGTQGLADRYTYIPAIGLFIMAAWGVPDLLSKVPGRRLWLDLTTTATLVACFALTWVQVGYWRDGITLFTHNAAVVGEHPRVERLLAVAYARAGRHAEAVERYRRIVERRPNDPTTRHLYAVSLHASGQFEEARRQYQQSIELDPLEAKVHYNYAALLMGRNEFDAAAVAFREALKLHPLPAAHNNLGVILERQGKITEAALEYAAALRISPVYYGARQNLERLSAEFPAISDPSAIVAQP